MRGVSDYDFISSTIYEKKNMNGKSCHFHIKDDSLQYNVRMLCTTIPLHRSANNNNI